MIIYGKDLDLALTYYNNVDDGYQKKYGGSCCSQVVTARVFFWVFR